MSNGVQRCECEPTLFDTLDGSRAEITVAGYTPPLGRPVPTQRWCARHGWVEARR